jgi:hypothetical protein
MISAIGMHFKRTMVLAGVVMLAFMLVNGYLADSLPPSLKW